MARQSFYLSKLSEELESRKRRNPAYTLRAFARQLGIAAPVLSEVLRRKRGLPQAQVAQISKRLSLSPAETRVFCESAHAWRPGLRHLAAVEVSESEYKLIDEERNFRIIAEWEYYAVFELVDVEDFSEDPKWISRRLGITENRARIVLEHLLESGLLMRQPNGALKKVAKQLTTTQDQVSVALRRSHQESLEMASTKLETVPIEERFFSSSTIAIDKQQLPEAKELIREFRQKLSSLLTRGRRTDVYQFAVQLFPLTVPDQKTKGSRS